MTLALLATIWFAVLLPTAVSGLRARRTRPLGVELDAWRRVCAADEPASSTRRAVDRVRARRRVRLVLATTVALLGVGAVLDGGRTMVAACAAIFHLSVLYEAGVARMLVRVRRQARLAPASAPVLAQEPLHLRRQLVA